MKIPTSFIAAAAVALTGVSLVISQDAETSSEAPPRPDPPKEGEPMNKEQLDYAIWFVEQHINTRNERAKEISEDIKRMDGRIEQRIDQILKMLTDHKDSVDSGSRVIMLKMQAIEGLKKTVQYYDTKRRVLKAEFMRPDPRIDRDLIKSDLDAFNKRVEKRVEQILTLTKSMPGFKDLDKYDYKGSGGYWGGHYIVRNPDYYHNRSQTNKTDRTQTNVAEELDKSIKKLKITEGQLERTLEGEITEQFRELLEGELERTRGLIHSRESQKQAVITADANPPGKSIGRRQAENIEELMNDMSSDLKRDFYGMFQHYSDLNRERAQLLALHEQRDGYLAELDKLE